MSKKKVFLSYSHADFSKLKTLKNEFAKNSIFETIVIAENKEHQKLLSDKVIKGIEDCDYFIPLLTKNSISNQWVNQEIGFAVAKNREILPFVQEEIMGNLKGFIHSQYDLPYHFRTRNGEAELNASAIRRNYRKAVKNLVDHLVLANTINSSKLKFTDLFPGKWQTDFILSNRKGREINIEVREPNKYYVNGKFLFYLTDLEVDLNQNVLSFTKVSAHKEQYTISNKLNIIEIGRKYVGFENNTELGKNISITYKRSGY